MIIQSRLEFKRFSYLYSFDIWCSGIGQVNRLIQVEHWAHGLKNIPLCVTELTLNLFHKIWSNDFSFFLAS